MGCTGRLTAGGRNVEKRLKLEPVPTPELLPLEGLSGLPFEEVEFCAKLLVAKRLTVLAVIGTRRGAVGMVDVLGCAIRVS